MNFCICDDNRVFCEELKSKLLKLESGAKVSCYSDSDELIAAMSLSNSKCDVFFLDIKLNNNATNGIGLAEKLSSIFPAAQIIFVTAFPEYASDVYEAEHCYFVKKSDLDNYLPRALEKAKKRLNERPLLFNVGAGVIKVLPCELLYIERQIRKTCIYTVSGECYTVPDKLAQIESALPEKEFVRCHNSILVPLRLIRSLDKQELTLEGGTKLAVSRSFYPKIKLRFARFVGRNI